MTIRTRTLLFIGALLAVFIAAVIGGIVVILHQRFAALEYTQAQRDMRGLQAAFQEQQRRLRATTEDWAHWDDMDRYARGQQTKELTYAEM